MAVPERTFTLEQIEEADADCVGFCVACGEEHSGIEPDAREGECEVCGAFKVYGAAEIAVMGLVV